MDKDNAIVKFEDKSLQMILSQVGLPQEFKVIGEKQLQYIADKMPDVYRNKEIFGRQNSQVSSKFMTLQMLKHGVHNAIKQIDAQIDKKREAIKENGFRLMKEQNELERLYDKLNNPNIDKFDKKDIEIDIMQKECNMADSRVSMEHTFKEIGVFMKTKEEIMKNNNISADWDESDWIKAEIKENIQTAFLHAVRDIEMTGRLNCGTSEWLFQFGINPSVVVVEVMIYLGTLTNQSDINALYDFLDRMYEKFGNEYKKSMAKIGIDNLITEDFAYLNVVSEQDEKACQNQDLEEIGGNIIICQEKK